MDGLGFEWLAKSAIYGLLLVAVGVAVVRWLARVTLPPTTRVPLEQWLTGTAVVVAALLIASHAARAWAHTAIAFGATGALASENLSLIVAETRWGTNWQAQAYAAVGLLITATVLRVRRSGWVAYSIAAVLACATMPLLGHAAGSPSRHLVHASHLIAGGAWLGTLAVLIGIRWRAHRDAWAAQSSLPLIQRFSPVALRGAAVVGATGLLATWMYLGSPTHLLTTGYGRLLLLKLLSVGVILACGSANWRRTRAGVAPRLGVMLTELAAAVVVVLITSVLTETEHP